jgi:hypothetical protein
MYCMSNEEIEIDEQIIEYIELYPFGREIEQIIDEFEEDHEEEEIRDVLERLRTNERIMHINNKWRT